MRGQMIHSFIYDLGGEVNLARVGSLLDNHPVFEPVDVHKTAPKYVSFARALTVRFRPVECETTQGLVAFDIQARVFEVGAVAFQLRVPFEVERLADLVEWGKLKLLDGKEEKSLEMLTRPFFEGVHKGLASAIVEPYPVSVEPERYAVFAITDLGDRSVADLLVKDRRALAGVLSGERDFDRLSPEEVEDNLRAWYRYYEDDLVVVDWDYSLVVEPSGKYEDTLFVMELANLELLELRVYDRYLDEVLDKAYDELNVFYSRRGLFKSARDIQRELADARIDLTRVTDEINNIGKIYGDWFLAKLHMGLAERFHLAEWEKIVNEKMQTLNELYSLASHEVEHRRGILLESMIVLLFIVDLILLFLIGT